MKKLWTALGVLLAAASAFGQQGKPMDKKTDVYIANGGVLVNNTDRPIIAYSVYWNGSVTGYSELVTSFLEMRQGKRPMIQAHSKLALTEDSRTQVAGRDAGGNRIIGAILEAVVFDDGEVVGFDASDAMVDSVFERMEDRISAEKDLHGKLLKAYEQADKLVDKTAAKRERDAAWLDVGNARGRQEKWAQELLRVKQFGGEAAAIELAKGSQRYPKIWRKQK